MFEWSDLRLFLAVAREGSALGAAKSLKVNQTTVSRRMAALEHALGLVLFERQNRGYRLTKHGELLLASAEQVGKAAENLHSSAQRLRRTVSGVVRLTASEAVANHIVIPIAAEFQQQYAEVQVEQVAADTHLDIVHGEADIAFRVGSHPDDPRLVARRLPDLAWAVYCSEKYAEGHGYPAEIGKVAQHGVVGFEGKIQDTKGYQWFIGHADAACIISRANTVPNMNAVLRSGLGIGILPCFVGDAEADLIRCFDPPPEMDAELWLLTSREARNSPQVRAFIDFAVPRIVAQKRRFSGQAERRSASSSAAPRL